MYNFHQHYVNGSWVDPIGSKVCDVINPATEAAAGSIILGNEADVDRAVAAARAAFDSFSTTTVAERTELMASIVAEYQKRVEDVAHAISTEMGAPMAALARPAQAMTGLGHFGKMLEIMSEFPFEEKLGTGHIVREAHRRVCHDHPLELARQSNYLQNRPCVGRRLHHGIKTQ